MILKNEIACWSFSSEKIDMQDFSGFSEALSKAESALSFLVSAELFYPHRVLVKGSWFSEKGSESLQRYDDIEGKVEGVKGVTSFLTEIAKRTNEKSGISDFLYPLEVFVEGDGLIYGLENGKYKEDNVVSVKLVFSHGARIRVSLFSTEWLPYSLDGIEQPDLYKLNGERLVEPFSHIVQQLGFEVYAEDLSDYCEIKGFGVYNFMDEDNDEPIPVDELGRCI